MIKTKGNPYNYKAGPPIGSKQSEKTKIKHSVSTKKAWKRRLGKIENKG